MNDEEPVRTTRERREARSERLRGWADKREAESTAAYETASRLGDAIPFGQPILAGHHSQGRDTRYRARIAGQMDASIEHGRMAKSMDSKAANIEAATEASIFDDDPDAIEALEARIAGLEAERARIKAYNASCRKGARDLTLLDDRQQADLLSLARVAAWQLGRFGEFPGYALSNIGGRISAARRRLAELSKQQ